MTESKTGTPDSIIITTALGTRIIQLMEIKYCSVTGNTTTIFLDNNEKIPVNRSLVKIVNCINSDLFYRINKNYLVKITCIRKIGEDKLVTLADGTVLKLACGKKTNLLIILEKIYPKI